MLTMKVIPIKIEAGITNYESIGASFVDLDTTLNDLIIANPNATFIGLASGDSMQGVGIFDGDLLVVDRAVEADHGDIIVAQYNHEFTCKQLDKNNACLVSANKQYEPVRIGSLDKFTLEGVVVSSIRLHRKTNRLNLF